MGVNNTEPRQRYIQLNAEAERKRVVAVIWSGGEAIRQKAESSCQKSEVRRGEWSEERLIAHLFGSLQKIEKEEECSDIEMGEKPGGSKSQILIEREGVAIERIEMTLEDLHRAHKTGQNWIPMR
jgi:hypothetical protein